MDEKYSANPNQFVSLYLQMCGGSLSQPMKMVAEHFSSHTCENKTDEHIDGLWPIFYVLSFPLSSFIIFQNCVDPHRPSNVFYGALVGSVRQHQQCQSVGTIANSQGGRIRSGYRYFLRLLLLHNLDFTGHKLLCRSAHYITQYYSPFVSFLKSRISIRRLPKAQAR